MVKKLNQQFISKILKEKNMNIFSILEFTKIFSVSTKTAQIYLHRQFQKKFFTKLRNGLYILSENIPNEMEIANRLYQPSYVSFEYALSFYQLISESVYTITSATTKATRKFECLEKIFLYHRIKKKYFNGYTAIKIEGRNILIATPEKALVDYLYFVYLDKKKLFDRLSLKKISHDSFQKNLKPYNQKFQEFSHKTYDRFKDN